MKRILSLALVAMFGATAQASLMITEVVDATLPGGLPKYVEIKNVSGGNVDLSGFSIGNYSNGGTTLGGGAATVLAGILAPGDVHVISYEFGDAPGSSVFFDTYVFDADDLQLGAFINGDDAVALFQGAATGDGSDATLIDVYGVIGVDGTGEPWETLDSYGFRNPDVMSPNPVFTLSEWTFAGANVLDGADAATIVASTTPGTHEMIPEPATGALALLAASFAGAVAMRSRLG